MELPSVINDIRSTPSPGVSRDKAPASPLNETTSATPAKASVKSDKKLEDRKSDSAETRAAIELTKEQAEELARRVAQQINIERRSLSFRVNDNVDRTIVSVIDTNTDEIIRQIPSEELIRLAEQIARLRADQEAAASDTDFAGVFLREKA